MPKLSKHFILYSTFSDKMATINTIMPVHCFLCIESVLIFQQNEGMSYPPNNMCSSEPTEDRIIYLCVNTALEGVCTGIWQIGVSIKSKLAGAECMEAYFPLFTYLPRLIWKGAFPQTTTVLCTRLRWHGRNEIFRSIHSSPFRCGLV